MKNAFNYRGVVKATGDARGRLAVCFVGMEWKAVIISSLVAGSVQEYGKK